jgi:flagellar biosynthesis/type III secretory pathway protein FliH
VGLPGLKGEQFVAGEHLLGVALTALMDVPPARRATVHAEALRRLAEARENDYRRYLLLDCLEAYSTLDEAQAEELAALLQTERYQGAQAMPLTSFEKGVQAGLEQGLQQGLQQGQRMTFQELLEARFGPLSVSAQERLESLSPERLKVLTLSLLKAQSLQELGLED